MVGDSDKIVYCPSAAFLLYFVCLNYFIKRVTSMFKIFLMTALMMILCAASAGAVSYLYYSRQTELAFIATGAAIVLFLVFLLILIFYVRAKFVKPIKKLIEASEKIASGDVKIQVNTRLRGEMGDLNRSFARAVERLTGEK